jgi:LAS superfamily LD-carboxypeptidase LdcB
MDNRNYSNGKKSAEDIFCEKFEQSGYSYERQRRGYDSASASRSAKSRKNRTKRTVLLIVLGIVLFSLWIVAAVSIFQMVLGDDAPPLDTDADTTGEGSQDTDSADTDEDTPPALDYIVLTMEEGAHRAGQLLLINAENKFDISYDKELKKSLVYVADKRVENLIVEGGDRLTSNTVEALRELTDAFKAETGLVGYTFRGDYGYCTANQQAEWYEQAFDKRGDKADSFEFKSGESEHETGRAFDLKVYEGKELKFIRYADEKYLWIYDNCYKYGIIYRYPSNKVNETGVNMAATSIHSDHFLYVGKAAAAAMQANGWSYNEFHKKILDYTYEGEHLAVTGADGVKY